MRRVANIRAMTRLYHRDLNTISLVDRGHPLSNRTFLMPEDIFDVIGPIMEGQGVASGVLLRVWGNGKIDSMLLGVEFTPEQMLFQFDDEAVAAGQGMNLVYVHTHDDTYTEYSPESGPLDHGLRGQLFPTDLDYEFITEYVEKVQPLSLRCYTVGKVGCARIYPVQELALHAPGVQRSYRDLFLLQLRIYVQRLGV